VATSAIAVVGLLIVSSQSSRVRSPIAARTASASVVSTAMASMPDRSRTAWASPTTPPYTAPGIRTWSPAERVESITAWMAAIPDAVTWHASAPSSSASASSSAAWVGFE